MVGTRTNRSFLSLFFLLVLLSTALPNRSWPQNLPHFELTNFDGRKVSSEALKGKTTILAFTFAKCVFGCPLITYQLKELDKEIGSPANLQFLHISVNPHLDTPEEIIKHFKKHDINPIKDRRWLFLTGTEKTTAALLADFKIDVKRTSIEGNILTEHTIRVDVINRQGAVVATFDTYQWEDKEMLNVLRASLGFEQVN